MRTSARFLSTTRKVESAINGLRGMPAFGTPEQIIENLSKVRDAGLAYTICNFAEAAYDTSGIDMFVNEVMPALQ